MRCIEVVIRADRRTKEVHYLDAAVERVAYEDCDDDDEMLQKMRAARPWCDFELGIVEA